MRTLFSVAGAGLVALTTLLVFVRPGDAQQPQAAEMAALMRQAVLTRAILKDVPKADGIRAVVYDWQLGTGTATLVAFDDGTTSLHLVPGGGIIGAGSRTAVRAAAASLLAEAGKVADNFKPTTDFGFPPEGRSTFYIVTDSATLTTGPVLDSQLQQQGHPLAALAARAQDVISQVSISR